MIFVSIGMIYGKSKAGNADEKGRTYIEESEKTAKQKNTEKSRKDSTESTKADSTIKAQMTEAQQLSDTEAKGIAEAEAVEASIQPGQYPVMGISSIRAWQLVNYFKAYGSTYPAEVLTQGGAPDIETFAQMYYEEATAEGVRPEVAFAQAMKETGCSMVEICRSPSIILPGSGRREEAYPGIPTRMSEPGSGHRSSI